MRSEPNHPTLSSWHVVPGAHGRVTQTLLAHVSKFVRSDAHRISPDAHDPEPTFPAGATATTADDVAAALRLDDLLEVLVLVSSLEDEVEDEDKVEEDERDEANDVFVAEDLLELESSPLYSYIGVGISSSLLSASLELLADVLVLVLVLDDKLTLLFFTALEPAPLELVLPLPVTVMVFEF
ncbi:hypothetical protein GGI05_004910 [Coemansia sp. RSA 2603]|nr:hypothetical protein GGI05_004910 [Coemansia sp. RSA 2603]